MLENTEMRFADAEAMGLSHDEWLLILKRLDRTPNLCELGIFSAMWSEHCSYKSSKKWLKTLPTEGPQVIQGPGENAGVVDIVMVWPLFLKLKAIIILHISSPIRGQQQVLAVSFVMCSQWEQGQLRY